MKIIFDIFPAFGHQHSSYKLAKLLQDEGHYICYLGEYKYFHDLPPFFSRRYINPHIFSFIENCNSSMWKNIFVAYKEIKHKYYYYRRQCLFQEYDKIIESIRPDLIILDHHYIQKAILYHKYNIPVIAVQTAPSSQKVNGIPPFNSFYIPKDSFISKVYTAFLWKRYVGIKHLRFYLNKYIYLGKDHISEVKSIAKEFNYNLKANIDYNYYKGYGEFGLKNIPTLLLSPIDFDFPFSQNGNQFSIGPLLLEENMNDRLISKRYLNVVDNILLEKKTKKISFIYCSLGTLNHFGIKNSLMIFEKLIEIARHCLNYRVVLSIGEFINPARLLPTPENVFVFKSLPQRHILKFCDMMIAHGGQNSITESIMNEVPVLIYPFFKGSDLGGNSARVVYHKIGNRGNIRKESLAIFHSKIEDVLNNPIYKENISYMKKKFEKKNSSKEALNIIKLILSNYEFGTFK